MPFLERPDIRYHYEVSGSGPPLVLIAGFMSDSASWGPLVPLLEPHFTLIRPDNRSTGRTTPWDAPCGPQQWAEDVKTLMEILGHAKYHVVGHSLGGFIGWQLAQTVPDRVASLSIAAVAIRSFERNTALFRALIDVRRTNATDETWLRLLYPWLIYSEKYETPGLIDAFVSASTAYAHAQTVGAMEHQLNALYGDVDPTPFESVPPVPLSALLAREDLLVPLTLATPTLTGVDTQIIEEAGHALHWDQPETVAEHIVSFAGKNAI